ncbi:MAG: binding-protein-dependent transport system inner rane component [Pseudonocardiales bacterium]|nr:binding-protein-dependent transport system inner rane component [Pseudonocardiales bacterium]
MGMHLESGGATVTAVADPATAPDTSPTKAPRRPRAKKPSQLRAAATKLRHSGAVTLLSLAVITFIVLLAVLGPLLPFYDPHQQNLSGAGLGLWSTDNKGTRHILGTDPLGVDTLSQLILGGRISLLIACSAALISAVIGTTLGAVAGYFGGIVDRLVGVAVDVTLAVPRVLILIPIIAVFGSSVQLLLFLIGVTGWALFARIVRAQVMSLKRRDYVDAAVMMGSSDTRVLVRHILPNTMNSVIVLASLDLGSVVLIESGLSYLGLGVRPPNTSWGLMINAAQEYVTTQPRLVLVPSVALVLLVLATNLGTRAFTSEGRDVKQAGNTVPIPGA